MADDDQQAKDHQEAKAKREEEQKNARKEIADLEETDAEDLPQDSRDWPGGKAQYLTFGSKSDEPYGEGPTAKLGPAGVVHHEGGAVSVNGEEVDNPEDYKGEPIAGGPTDPNSAKLSGEEDRSGDTEGSEKADKDEKDDEGGDSDNADNAASARS